MSLTLTPITLTGSVDGMQGAALYGASDGLGLGSQYLTFNLSLKTINPQNHSDASTREPLQYNGLDIETGMFIADTGGNTILKIISISDKGTGTLACVVEDVDMMSYRLNGINSMAGDELVKIFALNPEGEPVYAGSPFSANGLQKVSSRFSLNEKDDRVKFEHTLNTGLSKGDIVSVDVSGNLVKYGTVGSSETKLGIVVDVYKSGKDVFIKPFNDVLRNYSDAESLTGNPGQIYYTDVNNLGELTTTEGGKAVFMHLNNKIATVVEIQSAINPGAGDTITMNGITVFDGPNGDVVPDTSGWKDRLNTFTSSTFVSAAITQAPGQLNAEGNTMAYPGTFPTHDMAIFTNVQGSAPVNGGFPEITISDGNNQGSIIFNNPDGVVDFGALYEYLTPAAILDAFNAGITAAGLEITAELIDWSGAGQQIQLTTSGSATGITLTNVTTDEFGLNNVGSGTTTGLSLSASLGSETLTLTKASGAPIYLDGTPLAGGYLNQSGVVSSNSGRVPFLLMIESEGGGGDPISGQGVSYIDRSAGTETNADGQSSGMIITYTPFLDGVIDIRINGMSIEVSDDVLESACYFSADGGTTRRLIADIEANDTLYWNGSIAGYELEASDDIEIRYQKSSND